MQSELSDKDVQAFFNRANYLGGSLDSARALYADWAPIYEATLERFGRYLSPARIADLVVQFQSDRQCHILDMACGTGWIGAELAARGYGHLTGLDLSAEMLAEAARKGCYQQLILSEISLYDPGPGFDVVVSAGVLTMGHQGLAGFQAMLASLAPGGLIVADIEEGTFAAGGFAALLDSLGQHGFLDLVLLETGHFYTPTPEEPPHGRFLVARRTLA